MKDAFQLAFDVCDGKYSGQNRRMSLSKVKTTDVVLTDGMWNYPRSDASPVSIARHLHAAGMEVCFDFT